MTGSIDHVVRLWNPYVPSKPMAVLKGHTAAVLDVVVASGCGLIFSYSHDAVSIMPECISTSRLKLMFKPLPPHAHSVAMCLGPLRTRTGTEDPCPVPVLAASP